MTEGRDAGWWWGVSGRVSPWRNFLISYQGSTWGGFSGAFKMEEISIVCTIKCCLSTFPQVHLLFAHFISVQQEAIYYHQSVWTHCENKISNQMSRLKIDLTYQVIIWCQTSVINDILFAGLFFLLLDDRWCDRGPNSSVQSISYNTFWRADMSVKHLIRWKQLHLSFDFLQSVKLRLEFGTWRCAWPNKDVRGLWKVVAKYSRYSVVLLLRWEKQHSPMTTPASPSIPGEATKWSSRCG